MLKHVCNFMLLIILFMLQFQLNLAREKLSDIDQRITFLENQERGTVSATLEPIQSTPVKTVSRLYNNHTKIVFHDKKEYQCLAENIYYEGRGESYMGKIGIAQVTFNRAEKTGSFCKVVHEPKQFSWTLLKNLKKPKGEEWKAAKHAANMFVTGVRIRDIDTADHYHRQDVNPVWDNTMKKTAVIGKHEFYASR